MPQRPNFLFIQADQLAARALPAYGNAVAATPHIDALAGAGVVFESAYCNYPLCAPSRFSMTSAISESLHAAVIVRSGTVASHIDRFSRIEPSNMKMS